MHKITLTDTEARCDCSWYYISYNGKSIRVRQQAARHCVENAPAVILRGTVQKRGE